MVRILPITSQPGLKKLTAAAGKKSKSNTAVNYTTAVRFLAFKPAAGGKKGEAAKKVVLGGKGLPAAELGDFEAKPKQVSVQYRRGAKERVVYVGIGERTKITPASVEAAVHTAVKTLKELKVKEAVFHLPALDSVADKHTEAYLLKGYAGTKGNAGPGKTASLMQDVAKWITSFNYHHTQYKSKPDHHFLEKVHLVPSHLPGTPAAVKAQIAAVERGTVIGQGANTAKVLGNLRPDVGNPIYYANWAQKLATTSNKTKGMGTVHVRHWLKGDELAKKGLNLHYNVGKGAEFAPQLVVLEYIGNPKAKNSTALVGKGVTFDNGGLHVKPYGFMENMHLDMMGAATVLATMEAAAKLQLKTNIVAVVGLAENAISAKSYRPSSIIKSLKGTTVEVLNTDAEGRLVLADALTYVQDHAKKVVKKPTEIIDLATLTGAVLIALGSERAAVFSNNDAMRKELYRSGLATQEPLWPLPIAPEHDAKMKGAMSDLKNIGGGREAGSATAAAFLKHFINKDVNWSHLDIAGAGMNDKALGAQPTGVSGYGVAMLLDYLAKKQ